MVHNEVERVKMAIKECFLCVLYSHWVRMIIIGKHCVLHEVRLKCAVAWQLAEQQVHVWKFVVTSA